MVDAFKKTSREFSIRFFSRSAVVAAVLAVCASHVAAQSTVIHVDDGIQARNIGPGGSRPTAAGGPSVATFVLDANGHKSVVDQRPTDITASVGASRSRVSDTGATLEHSRPQGGVSAVSANDNMAAIGNFDSSPNAGPQSIRNGMLASFDAAASKNTVQTGIFGTNQQLSTGLLSDGTAGMERSPQRRRRRPTLGSLTALATCQPSNKRVRLLLSG